MVGQIVEVLMLMRLAHLWLLCFSIHLLSG